MPGMLIAEMFPHWFGLLCAGLAVAAFFLSYRWAASQSDGVSWGWLALSVLLAMPGASFALYYLHLFPEGSGYYQFRSWPGTELFLLPLGVVGGLIASRLPRSWLPISLLGVVAFSVVPFLKPFLRPIPNGLLDDQWNGAVCLQSTPSTCGAASVATILRSLGIPVNEAELAQAAHSYRGGTEAWYLARAARQRGCEVRFRFVEDWDDSYSVPAVVGVRLGAIGHFVPVLEREGNFILIGDPLVGPEKLTREELEERYTFTGFTMSVLPGEGQ